MASQAEVGIGISVNIAPPALPVYVQPPLPGDGYMWAPGYWGYGDAGFYWVPGTWVQPPSVGLLWTPGYWGWANGAYVFNGGYWGPHIGFYGGVNYGFGYGGVGFEGGYWRGGGFFYNRAVMNVGAVHVTNVYEKTVIVNNNTRVSFNGGTGGVSARPTPTELAAAHETHVPPTSEQVTHVQAASTNHALLASVNHGAPAVAATAKPGVFTGKGVVTASHAAPPPAGHTAMTHAAAPTTPGAEHPAEEKTMAPKAATPPVAPKPAMHAAPPARPKPPVPPKEGKNERD